MSRTSRRVTGTVIALGAVVAAVGMAAPASAQGLAKPGDGAVRVACGTLFFDKDNAPWQYFIDDFTYIYSGPSYDCQRIGQGQRDHQGDYHCFLEGEGGTWTFLRDDATGVQGWVPDQLLGGRGSYVHC